jgi:hypothetical protein
MEKGDFAEDDFFWRQGVTTTNIKAANRPSSENEIT